MPHGMGDFHIIYEAKMRVVISHDMYAMRVCAKRLHTGIRVYSPPFLIVTSNARVSKTMWEHAGSTSGCASTNSVSMAWVNAMDRMI